MSSILFLVLVALFVLSAVLILTNLCGPGTAIDYWNLDGEEETPLPRSPLDFLRTTPVIVLAFVGLLGSYFFIHVFFRD
ncbi:hypothetical protein KZJ38_01180 [Paraburkholderia edwinii]|uniref:Uncharacterized protein n=1 Tax=Paraburkholderia edwinii TaxID=2861782 RepID=A0ABX8UJ41_9BURK|nr:hypothetical protein [Paraburkholderia edwinii]QYD69043.1 hypothetical protein KZJ38_01180 [Paraburkholderia edwinii]